MTEACWSPGDQVVWRSRPYGLIGYVTPVTVVVDSPDLTVLFQAPGSLCKRRTGKRGGPRGRNLLADGWDGRHDDLVWAGPPTLRLYPWGSSHTIIRYWDFALDRAVGWYINLEAPWRRTSIGFDTQDLTLDVTVADDLSTWAWKDEDELDWSVSEGKYSVDEATAIRAEGLRVIHDLEAGAWPFHADWSLWRPDARWLVPTLPADWADASL
jgi:hypothetical protein